MKCTCDHEVGTNRDCPNCRGPVQKGNKNKVFLVLAVCLVLAGSGYYWFKTVYQPDQDLTIATKLLNAGQKSEAEQALRSFISDYPQHGKVAFAYGKLFELNFSNETKSSEILKILQEKYPSSDEYANSIVKSAASEVDRFIPLHIEFYNTGLGKDKYYSKAKGRLEELKTVGNSKAFVTAGGNDLIAKLNEIVNPLFGAIEFQLAISDYKSTEAVTSADIPQVILTSSDGTSAKVQYDKKTRIVSAVELAPGNYKLDINMTRTSGARRGSYYGGESLTIVPGRNYKDTTYLFAKSASSSSSDNIDTRYSALDNNSQTIAAKQITASSDSSVPVEISGAVLPQGYIIPDNDHYLFDLDNNKQNELIAYYDETRLLAILHWNGKIFEEQAKFQIGSNYSKLDFSMYPMSINLYNFAGISFPVLGLITTSGDSGGYPELTLLHWNAKDGYNVIWDATAGENGDWQLSENGFIMSQDNFSVGAQAGTKTRFTQEYEFNGTTFVLTNAYSSSSR